MPVQSVIVRLTFVVASSGALAGCASQLPTPAEVREWQAENVAAVTSRDGLDLTVEVARLDAQRREGLDLDASRAACFELLAAFPQDARLLWRASRAECDRVFVLRAASAEPEPRALAAQSGLVYAERAAQAASEDADVVAQLAFSLGTTTHLLPMGERAGRADEILEVVESARALNPDAAVALSTLATLRLRLATLPWIARVMSSDIPDGDVEEAERLARRCVELEPSLEYRLLLAQTLVELEREQEASDVLAPGVEAPDQYPRDAEVRPAAEALLRSLRD